MKYLRVVQSKVLLMSLILLIVTFYYVVWSNLGVSFAAMENSMIKIKTKNTICQVTFNDTRRFIENDNNLKTIYFVTPTYPRPEQVPELTRLSHTLMLVPRIHWIVADDQPVCSHLVSDILTRTGLPYTHISSPSPYIFKGEIIPRGVANRRAAITWLHNNIKDGILYFGDDDNTVDLQLFDEIRQTKKVSMFPVGLIKEFGVSSPIVKKGKVIGFFDSWPSQRKFPVDMAGFAVNLDFLIPEAYMPYIPGMEEDRFLRSLRFQVKDIEPLANNCSKILVWHTRTIKNDKAILKVDLDKIAGLHENDNYVDLLKEITRLGIAKTDPKEGHKVFIVHSNE